MLSTEQDRERYLRDGVGPPNGRARSLDEIGVRFNISWERARQTQARAMQKLPLRPNAPAARQHHARG